MKPISNTKECHPIQWSAPLQEERNISYLVQEKPLLERKKEDQHRYGYIQHGATITGQKHTFNEIFHKFLRDIRCFLCVFCF